MSVNNSPIKTSHDMPPIPISDYDWSACREDWDEGQPIGHGKTEEEAIKDLLQQEEDNEE
jgi:hypothetical protein